LFVRYFIVIVFSFLAFSYRYCAPNCKYGNQESTDVPLDMIECESCFRWYHVDCVQPSTTDFWVCENCASKKQNENPNQSTSSQSQQIEQSISPSIGNYEDVFDDDYGEFNDEFESNENFQQTQSTSTTTTTTPTKSTTTTTTTTTTPTQTPNNNSLKIPSSTNSNSNNQNNNNDKEHLELLNNPIYAPINRIKELEINGVIHQVPQTIPLTKRGEINWKDP